MTAPDGRKKAPTRREQMAKARQSRRPSRLGSAAGAAPRPDYLRDAHTGFPALLTTVWRQAADAANLAAALDILLTLGGHMPPEVQLRALRTADECAVKALWGASWRSGSTSARDLHNGDAPAAFVGELGLTTSGRIVVRVPSQAPLATTEDLVDGVLRVPWSENALAVFQDELRAATARNRAEVEDCRRWLAEAGDQGRDEILERLKEAALRTAPFVLYQEGRQYTNFRNRNTMLGKTLWPGHPDDTLSSLHGLPLPLWSDNDVMVVVCLTLLIRSGSPARIEEANGTELTLAHVGHLIERTRQSYNDVPVGPPVPPAPTTSVVALNALAEAVRARRERVMREAQLYREIHGVLVHKVERVAAGFGDRARERERQLCALLRERLPLRGGTLAELAGGISGAPEWLVRPHGEFQTGLESLVYETVAASTRVFEADFAMSRGMRSLTALVAALRTDNWSEIASWEISNFFCCVVPAPHASEYFPGSTTQVADVAWAISSRMQYNSWHFVPGNLPKVPAVEKRDYFIPPTIPDIAFYSDQHHHGHVSARVRFSIRSPQQVAVLGRIFKGFIDLRLLRCEGNPFDEHDLLAAHRASALVARATSAAAALVAGGAELDVTSFDSQWHWTTILTAASSAASPGRSH